jgi:hypothetical protein
MDAKEQALADQIKVTEQVIKEHQLLRKNVDMAKDVCRVVVRNPGKKYTMGERVVATTVLHILCNKTEFPDLPLD